MDRLSQIKPNNDTNVLGLQCFDFVSVLVESDLFFKTDGPQTLEVKEVSKLNDTIAQHHMLLFAIILPVHASDPLEVPDHLTP